MAVNKNPGPKLFFSQFGGEQPIPQEFIAAMERAEEIQAVPDDIGPEALSDEIVESKVETNRTDERVRRTVKKKPGNITLQFIRTNDQGQPVQVSRTLFPTGSTPTPPTATTNVAVQNLGNGWSIQESAVTGTYDGGDPPVFTPGVFPGGVYETEIPDALPPEFGILAPISTTEESSAGTVDTTPNLATGDLDRKESQLTQFIKRVMVRTRAAVTVPKTLVETKLEEGILTTVTKVYNTGIQTVAAAFLTTAAFVKNLGNNTSVKQTETVAAFPQRQGQDYDDTLDVSLPYTLDRAAMGTGIGDAHKEIRPVDFVRADVKSFDISALTDILDAYVISFPSTADLNLPQVLVSIEGFIEQHIGDGEYHENGGAEWGVDGSGGASAHLSLQGSGNASASVIPDIAPMLRQPWGQDRPVIEYMFFLPMPATAAQVLTKLNAIVGSTVLAQPKYSPVSHTFFCVGRQLTLTCKASSNWQSGGSFHYDSEDTLDSSSFEDSFSSGTGTSRDAGLSIKAVRLPPCIHGAITLSGTTTRTETITCSAEAQAEVGDDVSVDGEITGYISPTSLSATSNQNTIPSSGLYLVRVDGAPYKYGYARFRCVVVDYANVG